MLNIYYGSEAADKAKFIFEHIKGRTLLLVPDQFSLQAEKDAFFYLKTKGLIDLMVVDFSSLGHKVVKEAGGRKPPLIDKYGRHMLLTKILREVEGELGVYRGMNWQNSFIDMLNSLISEMKRYGTVPEDLAEVMDKLDEGSYLKYKLADVHKIFEAYQKYIEGKYLDSEDYITFYGDKITDSPLVKGTDVWIYGFDTFTPKNLLVIQRLLKTAHSVNVVMTYEPAGSRSSEDGWSDARFLAEADGRELFALTGYVISMLRKAAEEAGEEVRVEAIVGEKRKNVWSEYDRLHPVSMVKASNIYTEAESAAAYIQGLVRDEGFRYGDIVVVCNDYEVRGSVLRRTFMRYGIPVFMDRKRKVMHHPAVGFLLALMEVISEGYKDDAIMRMIKSGLMGLNADDAELLENYTEEFRIRGTVWKNDFTRHGTRYSDEDLDLLNRMRAEIVSVIETARTQVGARNRASEKISGLYRFLEDDFHIRERLENIITEQMDAELAEGAAETAQSWNVICNIFDQIVETVGEEKLSNSELLKLMTAGFEEIEIGLVPTNSDCVIIGTLQRTRLSRIKALVVTGANEGVLPMLVKDEGLLNDKEKETLENLELELSKRDGIARQEEWLAIYRTLSLPGEKLYMSCSRVDEKGEDIRPSAVYELLADFEMRKGNGAPAGDLGADGNMNELLISPGGTLPYVAEVLRRCCSGGEFNNSWMPVISWYQEHQPLSLDCVTSGVLFDNELGRLGESFADELYRGDSDAIQVSASRLEGYSRCPFAHFVKYGLRAEEAGTFGIGAGEIGDIYHECLMRLSAKLTPEASSGIKVNDPESLWMTVTREECDSQVKHILAEDMENFREGVLSSGPEESYRAERITEICSGIAWMMIQQVRKGHISRMYFEEPFGRGCKLPPVNVDVGGRKVMIRGIIDRMDIMEVNPSGGNSDVNTDGAGVPQEAVRIVDYKTGAESVNVDYFRSGYKLQLMIYLKAAMREPAGVFYFRIKDVDVDADSQKTPDGDAEAALQDRMAEAYRLEGIVVNDMDIIESMDGEFSSASQVIPVKLSKKDNAYAAARGGYLFTRDEFNELSRQVDEQVARICREICSGTIDIAPKVEREKDMDGKLRTSCRYCTYKSICMFDSAFAGCRYHEA
ncbi:MAG: PD-(D/E)XK nuclease family protein [Bacillota bacterium]|nr:PD-(D/E)XK nuclease family protein [Bacillota bacterium]